MPRYYGPVRPASPNANDPITPINIPPVLPGNEPQGYPEAPYPGDLTAGDGASRGFRPAPKTTGYSTNVPQPDNKGPRSNAAGDGKNGMAG
jgi:hypothetical protein